MSTPWENISHIVYRNLSREPAVANETRYSVILNLFASVLADLLLKGVPNVVKLQLENRNNPSLLKTIEGRIVEKFAPKLQSLIVSVPLPLATYAFSQKLTQLVFSVDTENPSLDVLPRIHSQSLRSLYITGITDQFSWGFLVDANSQDDGSLYMYEDVVFPSLKRLVLDYEFTLHKDHIRDSAAIHQRYKLHFPQLIYLSLYSFPEDFTFFKTAELPSRLCSLDIINTEEAVEPLVQSKLPETNVLRLALGGPTPSTDWDNENVVATSFLQKHHGTKSTIFSLATGRNYILGPQAMNRAKIVDLSVAEPMEVTEMLHFLFNMPDLDTLSICLNSFDDITASLDSFDVPDQEGSRPQTTTRQHNSKIRKLMIRDTRQGGSRVEKDKIALAAYLVVRFPTLHVLKFKNLDQSIIARLFDSRAIQ